MAGEGALPGVPFCGYAVMLWADTSECSGVEGTEFLTFAAFTEIPECVVFLPLVLLNLYNSGSTFSLGKLGDLP